MTASMPNPIQTFRHLFSSLHKILNSPIPLQLSALIYTLQRLTAASVDDNGGGCKVAKKHVKFPDNVRSCDDHPPDHEHKHRHQHHSTLQPHHELNQNSSPVASDDGVKCSSNDVGDSGDVDGCKHSADAVIRSERVVIDLDVVASCTIVDAGADAAVFRRNAAPPGRRKTNWFNIVWA